jgi:midasin
LTDQSDIGDLIGGVRPLDLKRASQSLMDCFGTLLATTFNTIKSCYILSSLRKYFYQNNWELVVEYVLNVCNSIIKSSLDLNLSSKRLYDWLLYKTNIKIFQKQIKSSGAFIFMEGSLVKAMKQGIWILMDEINLASPSILQRNLKLYYKLMIYYFSQLITLKSNI